MEKQSQTPVRIQLSMHIIISKVPSLLGLYSTRCLIASTRLQSEIVLLGSSGSLARLAVSKLLIDAS